MRRSRLIAFVLAAAMLLSWAVVPESHAHVHAHETDPTLTIASMEGKPGDTLQIAVTITNNPGVTILNTRVKFDENAVDVINSKNNKEGPLGTCTFMASQKDGTNPVTMYWESGLEDFTDDGIIGYIDVTIKADAKPGKYDVTMLADRLEAYNTAFDEISFDLVNGVITVLCAEHDFGAYTSDNNATCTADGTKTRVCQACGEKETVTDAGSALGHSFTNYDSNGDATCEADGTETAKCDRCEVTDTRADEESALGHSFTEYVSNGDATCESDGTETATCDRCDETDTRIDVGSKADAAHSFPAEYTSDGNATCLTDGTKSRVCTVCDEKETVTDVGSALGHSFTNYVSNGDATCEADGTETAKCDRCDVTDTRTAEGSKLDHSYTAQTTEYLATAADCCHKATYYYTCASCGKQGTETFEYGEVDLTNHVGGTEVRNQKPATEEEEGYTGDTYCLGCGNVVAKGESIPVLDHTHNMTKTEAKDATCTEEGNIEYWTCTKCGKLYADAKGEQEITAADTVVAVAEHAYTAQTTEYPATAADCCHKATYYYTCASCGKQGTETFEYGEVDLNNHVGGTEVRNQKPATEEEEGYTGDTYCLGCGNMVAKGESIPVLQHTHNMTKTEAKDATCTEEGNIAYWTCTKCGKLYADADGEQEITAADTVIAVAEHAYTAQTTEYPATAADCCHKATYYYTCASCGKQGIETFEYGEVDLNNHVGGTEVRDQKPATEEEEGYTGDTYCLGCGNIVAKGESIPVLDHTHDLVKTEAKDATCETAGNTAYWTCTKCGKLFADAEGANEITAADTVVSALGHEMGEYVSNGDATCEADGTETAKCIRCDVTDTRTAEGSALGHAWSEWTVTTPAGCETDGEETRTCGNCGKTETNVLEALGHEMGEYVSNGDATCEADGTETAKCSRCDVTDTRTAEGSALGHAWSEWTVTTPAGCETDGEETRTCGNCGKTETNVLEALGHNWTAGDVTVAPTCTDSGEQAYTCGNCGGTESRMLEALGHAFETYVSDGNASCDGDGTETAQCVRCEVTDTRVEEGSALEHVFGEWTVVKEATCTEAGEETRTCGACTDSESREIPALGHAYESVVTAPTTTEKGYTTHTCANCGDSYVDSYVDPIPGESDDNDDSGKPETGDGSQTVLWIGMLLMSAMTAGALVISRKKWIA